MATAAGAMHFRARHQQQIVGRGADRVLERLPEAWPAGAAVVFGAGREQRQVAARADESPPALLVIERTRARNLRAVQTQHVVLRFGEDAPPLAVRLLDLEGAPTTGVVALHEPP